MNPIWLWVIIPVSAFVGVALMCLVSIRATNDFHAAIARRDKIINCRLVPLGGRRTGAGELWVHQADGTVWYVCDIEGWDYT